MKPTIGRIVIYTLPAEHTLHNNGATEAPAVVVRVFDGIEDNKINLKVLLDGNETPWETSVPEGTGPRTWHWPARA
jgi:hypothetical protein